MKLLATYYSEPTAQRVVERLSAAGIACELRESSCLTVGMNAVPHCYVNVYKLHVPESFFETAQRAIAGYSTTTGTSNGFGDSGETVDWLANFILLDVVLGILVGMLLIIYASGLLVPFLCLLAALAVAWCIFRYAEQNGR